MTDRERLLRYQDRSNQRTFVPMFIGQKISDVVVVVIVAAVAAAVAAIEGMANWV